VAPGGVVGGGPDEVGPGRLAVGRLGVSGVVKAGELPCRIGIGDGIRLFEGAEGGASLPGRQGRLAERDECAGRRPLLDKLRETLVKFGGRQARRFRLRGRGGRGSRGVVPGDDDPGRIAVEDERAGPDRETREQEKREKGQAPALALRRRFGRWHVRGGDVLRRARIHPPGGGIARAFPIDVGRGRGRVRQAGENAGAGRGGRDVGPRHNAEGGAVLRDDLDRDQFLDAVDDGGAEAGHCSTVPLRHGKRCQPRHLRLPAFGAEMARLGVLTAEGQQRGAERTPELDERVAAALVLILGDADGHVRRFRGVRPVQAARAWRPARIAPIRAFCARSIVTPEALFALSSTTR